MELIPTTEKQNLGFFTYSYSMFPGIWEIPLVMWNDLQGRSYPTLQRQYTENSKQIIPEMKLPRNDRWSIATAVYRKGE
jgi:hypothetical protein